MARGQQAPEVGLPLFYSFSVALEERPSGNAALTYRFFLGAQEPGADCNVVFIAA